MSPQLHLRFNQLGYPPQDTKVALAFAPEPLPATFAVLDAGTAQPVFQDKPQPTRAPRWGNFEHFAALDFTPLQKPGRYRLRLGSIVSPAFPITNALYAPLPDQLLEFLRQQRCGHNPWLNADCHPFDGRTAYGPMPAGSELDARGGWHDAADLLKYLLTSGNATAQLLLAYRLNPGAFEDHVDARGHAGANGIPDVLDEARWGLEWLLKLHPQPDQLYHQVADDRDHCGWRLPQNESADYGWGKGSNRVVYFADGRPQGLNLYTNNSTGVANLAGRYAAAMALAYQIWKADRPLRPFAERCLQAGREVYQLGRAREGVQQGNCFRAPYYYGETTWADDMEWGAAELHRATGNAQYLADAKRYAQLIGATSWMGRDEAGHYQFYPFVNVGHYALHDLVDASFQKRLAGYYREGIERCVRAGRNRPYRVGVPFIWCSNNLLVGLVTQCELYERMSGDPRYRAFAAAQRDWLLGRNPWGYSMFTGIPAGGVFPQHPHLMTTRLTQRRVRGGLVDGPVYEKIFKGLRGVGLTGPDLLALFQSEQAVYHDDLGDYSTNEPTMDGTASAVLMFALLAGNGS